MSKLYFLLIFLFSCTSLQKSLDGVYSGQGKDANYRLELKPAYDFTITKDTSACKGKWMLMATDSVLLKCDNKEVEEKLFKDYLIKQELVLIVKNPNQLKLGTSTLKKVK
jgi:hypothetical protein